MKFVNQGITVLEIVRNLALLGVTEVQVIRRILIFSIFAQRACEKLHLFTPLEETRYVSDDV